MDARSRAPDPPTGTASGATTRDGKYQLFIPLDASEVVKQEQQEPSDDCCDEPVKPEDVRLRVAARDSSGNITSALVQMNADGRGTATLGFEQGPGALQLHVGPGDATDDELFMLDTLHFQLPERWWVDKPRVELPAVRIPPFYWFWWRRWCRTFVIRGRVVCADGRPVPGAEVCALDVDRFFIWSSTQQVGCTTTDANGAFQLRFRWCCNWWPWVWWRFRHWRLDPHLSDQVGELLGPRPDLRLGLIAGQQPTLDVFSPLLDRPAGGGSASGALVDVLRTDAGRLDRLREELLARLPASPSLAQLRIWPWWPWWPWRDCTPDIIFRVTQDCGRGPVTIVDENVWQTRWNIPNPLTVTLVANDQSCCVRRPCPPGEWCEDGECIVVDRVCDYRIDNVGGNLGAPATPVGYAVPGAVPIDSWDHHRPFAGIVPIYKNPGDLLGVDYLEFEASADGGATWNPLPPGAGVDFERSFWQPTGTPTIVPAPFKFDSTTFPGHTVLETREHRENVIGGLWDVPGGDRWWLSLNWDILIPIESSTFADGTWHFRAIGWRESGGSLTDRRVLPICGTETENDLVLTFDNQVVTAPGLHPASHHCGAGIHFCTLEPDTHILGVRINGTPVGPCDTIDASHGTVEIDFMAQDTATVAGQPRHVGSYVLQSRWGLNLSRNLLSQPSASVSVLSGGPSGWAAGQSSGNYGTALTQGAAAPDWGGGTYRLTMLVQEAFPEPCCYQLYLEAGKRTIVGGGGGSGAFSCHGLHWNRTQYAIGVGVCGKNDPAVPGAPGVVAAAGGSALEID